MSKKRHPLGPVIYSYTRAQAIEDDVLVDLTAFHIVRQLWKFHLACTDTVWALICNSGEPDIGVVFLKIAIAVNKAAQDSDDNPIFFMVTLGGKDHELQWHLGPGDAGEPVFTLMLPHED